MNTFKLNKTPSHIFVEGRFDESCKVSLSPESLQAIEKGRLQLKIIQLGPKHKISNFNASIKSLVGHIVIYVGEDNAHISLEENTAGSYDFRLWRNSRVVIGKNTTATGVRIVNDNSEFICGEDCMFSDEVLIQCADQHGIVDIESGKIINDTFKSVILGNHVWLGRQCTLTANANIGNGSVIGTGATVTNNIPEKVIAVGVPASVIKENHTWSRTISTLDAYSKQYIGEYR